MAINTGKVVLGGVVGGLVANVLDMVWNFTVMKEDMAEMAKRFGTNPDQMASFAGAIPWIVVDFVFGLVVVFTYASIRPRFGPGPRTAIVAGLIPFIAVSTVLYGFQSMGMMSVNSYVAGTATALVSTMVGSLAGCALYTEA